MHSDTKETLMIAATCGWFDDELIESGFYESEFSQKKNAQLFYIMMSPKLGHLKFGKTDNEASLLKRLEERRRQSGKTFIYAVGNTEDAFSMEKKFKQFVNQLCNSGKLKKDSVWVSKEVIAYRDVFDWEPCPLKDWCDENNIHTFKNVDFDYAEGYDHVCYTDIESLARNHPLEIASGEELSFFDWHLMGNQ